MKIQNEVLRESLRKKFRIDFLPLVEMFENVKRSEGVKKLERRE